MLASVEVGEQHDPKCFETKKQLREKNEILLRENAMLKSQFGEAVSITEQMERLHTENARLSAQLRESKAEKEDLAHRLQISLQSVQELKTKLSEQKKGYESQLATQQGSKESEVKQLKLKNTQEVEKWKDALEAEKKQREEDKVAYSMLINKVEHVVQNAERYLGVNIPSFDDLIEFLGQPPVVVPAPEKAECKADQAYIQRLERHVKKLKTKLRQAAGNCCDSEEQVDKLKRAIQELNVAAKQEQAKLQARITQLSDEKAILQEKSKNELEKVRGELERLKNEVIVLSEKVQKKQKKVIVPPAEPVARIPPVQLPTKMEKDFLAAQEQLMNRIADLTEQVRLAEKKKEEMAEKVKEAQIETQGVCIELEKQKNELMQLNIVNKEAQAEIESLRAALHARPPEEPKPKQDKKKVSAKKCENERLRKELESQRVQVMALSSENQQKQTKIEECERKVRELDAQAKEADKRAERASCDLQELRLRAERQASEKPDCTIPPYVFLSFEPDLDPSVMRKLTSIANNMALQPASKIQSCFKAISKYYQGLCDEVRANCDKALDVQAQAKAQISKVLVEATIALDGKPVTYEEMLTAPVAEAFVASIANLKAKYESSLHDIETLSGVIDHFCETFDESGNPIEGINRVKDSYVAKTNALFRKGKKCKILKSQLVSCQRQLAQKIEEAQQQSDELNAHISEIERQLTHSESTVKKLRARNQDLSNDLSSEKAAKIELERALTEAYEEKIAGLKAERVRIQLQFTKDLEMAQNNLAQLTEEYEEGQEQIQKLRKLVQTQKGHIKRQQIEHEELQKLMEIKEEKARELLETEKAQLVESFEATVAELREQCTNHRNDVQKLAAALAESEAAVKQGRAKILEVCKEKKRLETDLSQLNEQVVREKQLIESTTKAKILALDSQYNSKLEEAHAKAENEQRAIYAFVADAFRSFYNPCQVIDSCAFKIVVEKTRDELCRLRKSDREIRQMLGAFEGQTTQDAVARHLMESH